VQRASFECREDVVQTICVLSEEDANMVSGGNYLDNTRLQN